MPVKPEEIENQQFTIALRGYDKDEVGAFLRVIAADYRELLKGRSSGDSENDAAVGEEITMLLRMARQSAEKIRQEAERDARAVRAEAERDAARLRDAAEREANDKVKDVSKRAELLEETEEKVRQRLFAIEEVLHQMRLGSHSSLAASTRQDEPPPPLPLEGRTARASQPAPAEAPRS